MILYLIDDNGGGKWLYYKNGDQMYLHEYNYEGARTYDARFIKYGDNPVEDGWAGNEIEDYYPVLEHEADAKETPLFGREDEGCGWWIAEQIIDE